MRLIDADAFVENFDIAPDEWLKGRTVRRLVDEQPAIEQPTWISVEDRLPTVEDANRFGEVLAITKNSVSSYPYEWIRRDEGNYYIYWLPFSALPQPPKGVE